MNSQQIQLSVYSYLAARGNEFDAPYGILQGEHTNKKGVKYKSVTFGRARTLDATVEIYNRNFMILRTSRHGSQVYKNYDELKEFLNSL
jgi:hypothetical protein